MDYFWGCGCSYWVNDISGFFSVKFFSSKLLEAKFDERLANFKHAQQEEIEKLKFKINTLTNRSTKIHEKEFEYLPFVWKKLNDAYEATKPLLRKEPEHPNFNDVAPERLDIFLSSTDMPEWQREDFKKVQDKNSYWTNYDREMKFKTSSAACDEFIKQMLSYSIFFPANIQREFEAILVKIIGAATEYSDHMLEDNKPVTYSARNELNTQGFRRMETVRDLVHARLWDSVNTKI